MNHPALSLRRHQQVQHALEATLAAHRVEVHYQTQNQLSDGARVGFEALCRLPHAASPALCPDEFIPVAEETGLIVPLERQVLSQVALDLPRLLAKFPQARISLNLSTRHMMEPDFFSYFQHWLRQLPHASQQRVDFEITETYLQNLPPDTIGHLTALRQQGVRIVMDDFGVGQSSLARLHALPFDVIKLHQQFVQHINHPMVHAIVDMVVKFTRQFGLGLIAEGVETQAQYEVLRTLGCPTVQGFIFGEPAPLSHWLSLSEK